MKPGRQTSEFWLTAAWAFKAFAALAALFSLAWHSPWAALVCMPAVIMLVWMAGPIVNNYAENRYLLKRGDSAEDSEEQPRQAFGFGHRLVEQREQEEEGEE